MLEIYIYIYECKIQYSSVATCEAYSVFYYIIYMLSLNKDHGG